jgi:hypothetical protein
MNLSAQWVALSDCAPDYSATKSPFRIGFSTGKAPQQEHACGGVEEGFG